MRVDEETMALGNILGSSLSVENTQRYSTQKSMSSKAFKVMRPPTAAAPRAIGGLQTQHVYHGSFLDLVRKLPDQSVDVVIADPPYNASKGNALALEAGKLPGAGGSWRKIAEVWDDMSLNDYFSFTLSWLTEVQRVLKQDGSMWVHGTYHSAGITNVAMQYLNIEIINEVIWYKRNSFPNLAGRRLTASHETILWAHRGGKRAYRFNYEHSKKGDFSDDALKSPGKQMRTVWDLPNNKPRHEQEFGKHPSQKPVRLARRCIQLAAAPGDICLVPFAGSGTECVAALEEGLHYIGFETEKAYLEIARARLKVEG
jgi:site-specific DNA-methyltransferase (adenine-specific)